MITDEILFIIDENKQLSFNGSEFKEAEPKKVKEYFSASSLAPSLLRTHGFKISKSASVEKIEIQSEMKMFDEANLDPDTDFKISPLTIPLDDDDDNYIESYAIETSKLDEMFSNIANKNKHIDIIYPTPLSYSSLYSFEHLEKKSDLFIHLGDDESYAVIFKNGQYISTRGIASINDIAQKVGVDLDKMKEILSTKGVDNSLYSMDEFLQMGNTEDELTKIAERVSHSIGHKRGVFKLETIDRIYLDFEGSDIPGFLNLFDHYGYESATKQTLDIFNSVEVGMKHLALNALYALGAAQEKLTPLNLSLYERKPAFLKTHVGHLSIVMIVSLILASLYPIYATIELEQLSEKKTTMQNKVKKVVKATKKLQKDFKETRANRDMLRKEMNADMTKIRSYSHTIDALQSFDKEAISRQKMMKDINIAMRKYKLSSKLLEYSEDRSMKVQIITTYNKRDNISKFIKNLLSQGYSHVQTRKVEKTENYYESFVEIHR